MTPRPKETDPSWPPCNPDTTGCPPDAGQPGIRTTPIQEGYALPEQYFNRELSWIEFNARVLHEALDERTPLLERLKFLAIFESNLDEFFMVRVAVIRRQLETGVLVLTPDGLTPQQQLQQISNHLRPLIRKLHTCFRQELVPKLAEQGIHIRDFSELAESERQELRDYFERRLFPVLTPLAVDPGHPFPYISNLSLSLAVVVRDPETGKEHFARVKVPNTLPRFVPLRDGVSFVPLDQVIAHHLEALFVGMQVLEYYPFRITRDADLEIQEDEADDLLAAIQEELRKRRFGSVVRMEIASQTPAAIRQRLSEEMRLNSDSVYEVDGLLSMGGVMAFLSLNRPDLKDPPWGPVTPPRLRTASVSDEPVDIFAVIREGDLLVHHPYDSFAASVERFLEEAANDPQVLTIKQTLYRTSGDSTVVKSLIQAAENGKQVAALVELKARFDEENNILWAKKLEKAGVHVAYGLPGLKIHCKLALVVREEGGSLRRYVHIGTGNYNPKTARIYTDLGLFTCDETLCNDVTELFNLLTGYSRQRQFRKLLVAPRTLRQGMEALIRREMRHAQAGGQGRIIVKINSLTDPEMIRLLYKASQAGVEIDLIVRGMCCLKPGIPGLSDRIRVISIIGRFLEHSRIFYFYNNGQEEYFIGSADYMTRNLDRRVEVVTPVEDPALQRELKAILDICLTDNRQAWELRPDGTYVQRQPKPGEPVRSTHQRLMERAASRI